jgi:mono/diheme cytochrome c family protein
MTHILASNRMRPATRRHRLLPGLLLAAICAFLAQGSASFAADAVQGKVIAQRWCSGCHLVEGGQKSPVTDQAPSFATIATMPGFGADRLALLLLAPHPNMPNLALSRFEVANLADYILTLK